GLRWCARCVLPDSRPNLVIGENGVCNACRAHGHRPAIDWDARAREFTRLVERTRARASGYDCLIPVSGGKDSTWQVVTCLQHGLRPLCVTWRTPGRTAVGQRNLDNLISLGVDHIDYQVSPVAERRFVRAALERLGDPAIPMHMALFAIPLTLAVRLGIPLVVWGENSAVEYGSADGSGTGHLLDAAWLQRFGVTHGTTWQDWLGPDLEPRDLVAYRGPSERELAAAGVEAVFLGHYLPWDPAAVREVAHAHGFRPDPHGPRTGLYDYADIDDEFISVHHWLKWHKFGFTRTFDNLSLEIRNGRMTRDEAVALIRARGWEEPTSDIAAFCAWVGMSRAEWDRVADGFRDRRVWERRDGLWTIPGFLVPDWHWTEAAA
ncbi:MAG TPA: N-acetyl sugar amidotransferase, partial [Miltoncostaeaceae bacterium]|nr:N-acetyl sugar amidotransferase [Miltoncostaeaceae bacterium]